MTLTEMPKSTASGEGHVSVLLHEAVAGLNLRSDRWYADGTFGGGGHTQVILTSDPQVAGVIAIDADPAAAPRAARIREGLDDPDRLRLVHDNFRNLGRVLDDSGHSWVAGVLLDLGLSSYQLDQAERGFSFRFDAPLDMRFDTTSGQSVADLLAEIPESDLATILWQLGEERNSRRIAAEVVKRRESNPIRTTGDLASLVERVAGGRKRSPIHPATRTFQALRIVVNDELQALREGLEAAIQHLEPGGRLVVISFHSLEDRIVKQTIEQATRTCVCPPDQPICTCDTIPRLARIGKPVRPSDDEQAKNSRSRSAIMRIAERRDDHGRIVSGV